MTKWKKKGLSVFLMAYRAIISGISWSILLVLLFLCIFSTCAVDYLTENTFFISDSVARNSCAVIAVVLLVFLLKKTKWVAYISHRLETDEAFFLNCRRILLCGMLAVAALWVITTQYIPRADQLTVQSAVSALRNKDYSMFAEKGYLARYPHQIGLVLICYLFSFLFGSENYLCFQLINAVGLVFFYRELSGICNHCGMKRVLQIIVIVMGYFFFPLIMYCSFVYGNLLGLAFAVAAIKKEMDFFQKEKISLAVLSGVFIFLAAIFKSNYLIFGVGMLLYAIVHVIQTQKRKHAVMLILLLAVFLLRSVVPVMIARQVTGEKLDQGTSSWSWIAMGLQEGEKAPGW